MNTAFNPNGSICAIEGIHPPDGRVFSKMGHTERIGKEFTATFLDSMRWSCSPLPCAISSTSRREEQTLMRLIIILRPSHTFS